MRLQDQDARNCGIILSSPSAQMWEAHRSPFYHAFCHRRRGWCPSTKDGSLKTNSDEKTEHYPRPVSTLQHSPRDFSTQNVALQVP